jgi:hypothetical protein
MRTVAFVTGGACALLASLVLVGSGPLARATELPAYLRGIVGVSTSSVGEVATKNILQLNTSMFDLYADAGLAFRKNILARHPVILGLFSGAGGRFILYRPGMAPLEAPPVPAVYALLKSVAHSAMALGAVVGPYLNSPDDASWRGGMAAYRSRIQTALESLDASGMQSDWRPNNRSILQNDIAFIDGCLAEGISLDALQAFSKRQAPLLKKSIAWAAQIQVAHWMGAIGDWKAMLGADWDMTYAATNSIYVTRQNNILFSLLAQYMAPRRSMTGCF